MTRVGELEGEIADQVRAPGLDELVDQRLADGPHDLGFPAGQRLRLECRGDEVSMVPVRLALHGQDGRSDEQTDGAS